MNIITSFLTMQQQLRIFHWQTKSYSQHMAFGAAYEDLDGLIDQFIEVFQGKNGLLKVQESFVIKLQNLSENPKKSIDEYIAFLTDELPGMLKPETDTDLLNIRDEMLAVLNKTKYLLNLS